MRKIGYARVSMVEQNLNLQIDALKKVPVDQIFSDKLSGSKDDRPGLAMALEALAPGDSLIVWKLDRLGRSLAHLVETVNSLKARGIEFISLTESIDTSTPTGKLTFHLFAAMAEFVRDTIRERTLAGIAAARARGRVGGQRHRLQGKSLQMFKDLSMGNAPKDVCEMLAISPATYYRYKEMIRKQQEANP